MEKKSHHIKYKIQSSKHSPCEISIVQSLNRVVLKMCVQST